MRRAYFQTNTVARAFRDVLDDMGKQPYMGYARTGRGYVVYYN